MSAENEKTTAPAHVDAGAQALADALRSSFFIVKAVMWLLLAVFLLSGFFIVGPQEKAIILRFGQPVGTGENRLRGPGLHWGWPPPIDEVVRIPITQNQQVKSTVGWFAVAPGQEGMDDAFAPPLNPAIDGYTITADGNIVHVRATLSYRVDDAPRCVFEFAGAQKTFDLSGVSRAAENALNNALVYTASHYNVDDILTRDKIGFGEAVKERVKQLILAQNLGISVLDCVVESRPPRQLKMAFESVIVAGQMQSKVLDDARTYANQTINRAGAEAQSITNVASVENARLVAEAQSDANRFESLLPAYEANRTLFMQQQLVQTMGRVFTNVQDKMYVPTSPNAKTEIRLNLNPEPKEKK